MSVVQKKKKQDALLPYQLEVHNKLRRCCPDVDPIELLDDAKVLANATSLAETYFPQQETEKYNREMLDEIAQSIFSEAIARKTSTVMEHSTKTEKLSEEQKEKVFNEIKSTWRVKLILTPLEPRPFLRRFARVIQTVFQPKYGLVHTILQVGPFLLDWNDSSLCIPSDVSTFEEKDVILTLDLEWLPRNIQKESISTLAQVIAQWNKDKTFNSLTCNCQHFVGALLNALGISTKFTGILNDCIKQVKDTNPGDEVKFTYKFIGEQGTQNMTFATHKEFDGWLDDNKIVSSNRVSQDDLMYLKALDRVFWMKFRYYSKRLQEANNKEDKEEAKAMAELVKKYEPRQCPFEDPEKTGTLCTQ